MTKLEPGDRVKVTWAVGRFEKGTVKVVHGEMGQVEVKLDSDDDDTLRIFPRVWCVKLKQKAA